VKRNAVKNPYSYVDKMFKKKLPPFVNVSADYTVTPNVERARDGGDYSETIAFFDKLSSIVGIPSKPARTKKKK
jgi:hypothetical protein